MRISDGSSFCPALPVNNLAATKRRRNRAQHFRFIARRRNVFEDYTRVVLLLSSVLKTILISRRYRDSTVYL